MLAAQMGDFFVHQINASRHTFNQAVSNTRIAAHEAEELIFGITITVQGSLAITVAVRRSSVNTAIAPKISSFPRRQLSHH